MNALEPIVAATRQEVAQRKQRRPLNGAAPRSDIRDFAGALARPGLSLIAEHKRRSPSAGAIREDRSVSEVVGAYERGGAAALSILTEGPNFGGSVDDLPAARAASSLPLLRKDFIVDPYQVLEAHAAGADAVLLIVAALTPGELAALHEQVLSLGLTALVEVHDEREMAIALDIGAQVIGINNRDLTTLEVNRQRGLDLVGAAPEGVIKVAESGFSAREELRELQDAGFDAVLMGEALMRSEDIEAACSALTAPTM